MMTNFQQDKGISFVEDFIGHAANLVDEIDQLPGSEIVVLEPNYEEAFDIWLFKYNSKIERWLFSGIYLNGLFDRLDRQGYYKKYNPDGKSVFFLQDEHNLISEVLPVNMRDSIREYVDRNQEVIKTDKYSVLYSKRTDRLHWTNNSLFNDKTLQGLQTHLKPILQDDATTCYLPFLNGIIRVTKEGIDLKSYSTLGNVCLWKSQVIQRKYKPELTTECHFAHFVANTCNDEPERILASRTALGYILHSYNRPSEGQAIICCDEELTDKAKPQGGTGKGVWVNAAKQIRPGAYIDGKKFDPDHQFSLQAVNRSDRFVWLDDVKNNFSFDRFFSILTGGWTIEKKNQPSFTIPAREGPKLVICTNTAPNNEGSSNIRRQFILEFSDYYKKLIKPGAQPIRDIHGCEFFADEWDADEWARFDRFMVECVYLYMKNGLVPYKTHNVSANRLIQTTSDEFFTWVTTHEETGLQPNQSYNRPQLLTEFRQFAGMSEKELPSRRFTEWIKRYSDSQGWKFKLGSSNKNPSFILESKP
ncbi:hypothetical protein [Spirosoma foliorum]|uniref:Uncharacterized protein n=1 Tax=Spirosoma foliorum TaxID=2710596 RepID=A0A7G5GTV7_9BACT|nr:hypothetical protein [Spirosoma foliorum]QMW02299.1 hypothetical protein H3H32_30980 [Spirosoma foliorum]